MKRQIRLETFETNSSSLHTLQISTRHRHKSKLRIQDDGYVHVQLNEYYGKEEKDYKGQREKLTYVVTWMYIYYGCNLEELFSGYMWKEFSEAFCKHVGNNCLGIWIDKTMTGGGYYESSYDYLDHQSNPYGSYDDGHCVVHLYNTEELLTFIFNPYLWLHTDCD